MTELVVSVYSHAFHIHRSTPVWSAKKSPLLFTQWPSQLLNNASVQIKFAINEGHSRPPLIYSHRKGVSKTTGPPAVHAEFILSGPPSLCFVETAT